MPAKTTLSQLEAFQAVAAVLNYTRAAEMMGYSESAVYQQVHALERSLGLKLFFVNKHRLQLSSFGSQLAQLANDAIARVHDFELVAQSLQHGLGSHVTLAAGGVTTTFLLSHVLGHLRNLQPDVHVEMHVALNELIIPGVIEGRFQVGIVATLPGRADLVPKPPSGVLAIPWISDEWMLVRAARRCDEPADPSTERLPIFYGSHYSYMEPALEALLTSVGFDKAIERVALETMEAVKSAAIGGLGDAFLTGMSAISEFKLGLLVRATPSGIRRQLFLIRAQEASRAVNLVWNFLVAWSRINMALAREHTAVNVDSPAAYG